MPTRCFMPPESSRGYARSKPSRPTIRIACLARAADSASVTPRACSTASTFPSTVIHGKSAKPWKTIAIPGVSPLELLAVVARLALARP